MSTARPTTPTRQVHRLRCRWAVGIGVLSLMAWLAGCDRGAKAPTNADVASRQPAATVPPITFEPPVLDLGLLGVGEAAKGTVKIRNVGDRPLTIARTVASCACTYARDLAGTVLQPGEAVDLTATLTPKPGLGIKREKITVFVHGFSQVSVLDIRAEVSLPVRALPPYLEAYKVGMRGEIAVNSMDQRPFRILRADGKPPVFVDFNTAEDEPRNQYTLRWDLTGYTRQTIRRWWVVETDHPRAPLVDLQVRHDWTKKSTSTPRWILGDRRILAGVLSRGESYELKTKLQFNPKGFADRGTPVVRPVTGGIDALLLAHEIVGTDVYCTIQVTVLKRNPGLLYERLSIALGGYDAPITFIARVEG